MKHSLHYLIVAFLLASILPGTAMGRTHTPLPSSVTQHDQSGTTPEQLQALNDWHQSDDLKAKISALGTVPVATFAIPVLFGVGSSDISPNFGDQRPTRLHEGEDIMAIKGTPIVSPTDAVVIRVNFDTGAGNSVYTANPGGETFVYYHLDRTGEGVVRGQVLQKGSLIGYVGNTGNASGGAPHLHFEIRTTNGNVANNPFPRLAEGEFPINEKILYLSKILTQTADPVLLSQFLVTNFRSTFVLALASNIALPLPIIDALASIPAGTAPGTVVLPAGDLDVGSQGPLVVALQKYLIQSASGSASVNLAGAGATGNFGPLTKSALLEFQVKAGISPATGYYGATTRAYMLAHPLSVVIPPAPPVGGTTILNVTRNLYFGITGADVLALQKVLNARGYTVAPTGPGSPGNETTMFGFATRAAVIKFQIAKGILPAAGYVGIITRAMLATL